MWRGRETKRVVRLEMQGMRGGVRLPRTWALTTTFSSAGVGLWILHVVLAAYEAKHSSVCRIVSGGVLWGMFAEKVFEVE